ncbi:hypothetical protein ACQEPB_06305 [Novosphingobium fluoreni]
MANLSPGCIVSLGSLEPCMNEKTEQDLRHALGNARAETEALKSMLGKAADSLEDIVEANCSTEEQEKAIATARRLRRVIERTSGSGKVSASSGSVSS